MATIAELEAQRRAKMDEYDLQIAEAMSRNDKPEANRLRKEAVAVSADYARRMAETREFEEHKAFLANLPAIGEASTEDRKSIKKVAADFRLVAGVLSKIATGIKAPRG